MSDSTTNELAIFLVSYEKNDPSDPRFSQASVALLRLGSVDWELRQLKVDYKTVLDKYLEDEKRIAELEEGQNEAMQAMAKVQEFSPRVSLLRQVEFILTQLDGEKHLARNRLNRIEELEVAEKLLGENTQSLKIVIEKGEQQQKRIDNLESALRDCRTILKSPGDIDDSLRLIDAVCLIDGFFERNPVMTDSGRTPGDAEHHAELGRERAAVNAEPESTASELADSADAPPTEEMAKAMDRLATCFAGEGNQPAANKYFSIAKELRRLSTPPRGYPECSSAIISAMSQENGINLIRVMHANEKLIAELEARITKLEAELTRRDEVLESMDQASQWYGGPRLVTLKDVLRDNKKIRNEMNPS